MGLHKTVLTLGIACAVPAIVCVAANTIMKHHKAKMNKSFNVDECFDEMFCSIKQIHKQQKEQEERLSRLKENLLILVNKAVGK